MIKRFEKFNIPNLDIQEKYLRIIRHYSKDIENVMKVYTKSNKNPPIARNLPPTGNFIYHWFRILLLLNFILTPKLVKYFG